MKRFQGTPDIYLDIHTHHRRDDPGILSVVNHYPRELVSAEPPGDPCYSAAVHPWYIRESTYAEELEMLGKHLKDANFAAVGEAGLDALVNIPMKLQAGVFKAQALMAEQAGRPMIIHCVRAYPALLEIRKSQGLKRPWIIHGFTGKRSLAEQLLEAGLYLSFGRALLDPAVKIGHVVQHIPHDRIFLETDVSEHLIEEVYAAAAGILGLELPALKRQLFLNFSEVVK